MVQSNSFNFPVIKYNNIVIIVKQTYSQLIRSYPILQSQIDISIIFYHHISINQIKQLHTIYSQQILNIMPRIIRTKQQIYEIERILAATFISDKIGYTYKLNELICKKKGYQITSNYYTNKMTTIIRNVYRKIQEFMTKQCKRKVKPISVQQFNILRSPLLQVRDWLYADQLQTFFKFVRLKYNINGDVDLVNQKAIKLYGQIILTLEKQSKMDLQHLRRNKNKTHLRRQAANCHTYRTFQKIA